MKRKMLGALLLPLPFAALPIAAVMFSAKPVPGEGGLVVQTPMPFEQQAGQMAADLPAQSGGESTLAYGVGSRAADCVEGPSPYEG
ncbi:MAG: hypothetical protein AMXMBFR80_24840 [Dehalococcoidia bacterium]|nr:hypothetical protein [Tepidiformaceae bacterium]